jgi:hypothetical protein
MYIYVHIYILMCMYVKTFLHINVRFFIEAFALHPKHSSLHLKYAMYLHTYIYIYVYMCICSYIYIYIHICMYVKIFLLINDRFFIKALALHPKHSSLHLKYAGFLRHARHDIMGAKKVIYICTYTYFSMYIYVYIYIYMYIYVYIYVYTYIFIHICGILKACTPRYHES